jgi:hypothetical protein
MNAEHESPARRGPLTIERASALRERLVARDERALEELIVLATPWLLGVAQGMLSDADEAEDVVLDAFRILWDRVDTLSDDQPGLMPWLLRIVRNRGGTCTSRYMLRCVNFPMTSGPRSSWPISRG